MNFINGVILIDIITAMTAFGYVVTTIAALVGGIIACVGAKLAIENSHSFNNKMIFIIGLIIEIVGAGIIIMCINIGSLGFANDLGIIKPNGEYRVIVTDDVDTNEFQEKYEIINYDNGCYTISIK